MREESSAVEVESEPLVSWRRVTQAAFVVLLAIVVARATMSEFARDPFEVSPGQPYAPMGAGAGSMVVINLLCWLPGLLVLLRRAGQGVDDGGGEYRLSRACGPVVWVATGALAVASAAWASDKFLAVLTGSTWLGAGALCWGSAQLVRSWARFRAVMATVAGILLVYCAAGIYYRTVELPELRDVVMKTQDKILAERDFEPGSFAAKQFIQKITAGEMVGFGSSANTYAAMLVLCGVVTAGLLVEGIARRRDPALMFMLGIGLLAALVCGVWAASKTAAVTPLVAAGLVAFAWWARRWAVVSRKKLFLAGALVVLLGLAAAVGHGLYHGGLPGASLNFRWRYWVGAMRMFEARPWKGVGWASFGETYLRFRVPAASEEVKDPHNFLVRFATELGAVGLLGCVLWQAISWWEGTRPSWPPRRRGLAIGALGLTAALTLGMALNAACSVDFNADPNFVIIEMFKRCMFLGALVVGGGLALIAGKSSAGPDDGPSPWTLWAAGAGVATLLLHNLVDFSLFENGPMVVVALLWGSVIGVRSGAVEAGIVVARGGPTPGKAGAHNAGRGLAVIGALAVVGWMFYFAIRVVGPVVGAEGKAWEGDDLLRRSRHGDGLVERDMMEASAAAYEAALKLVPTNADYAFRAARVWDMGLGLGTRDRELLEAGLAADPKDIKVILQLARLEARLGNFLRTVELFGRAVELNPNDVEIRLNYAEALEHVGRGTDARDQILEALRFNDLLDPAEPKRLEPSRVEGLREKVKRWPR